MTKYIDADNLINELSAACMPIYEKGITGILGDNSSIADIINEQPTADVQEVKHGEWQEDVLDNIICSACGESFNICDNDTERFIYCPSCGARMDGVANG